MLVDKKNRLWSELMTTAWHPQEVQHTLWSHVFAYQLHYAYYHCLRRRSIELFPLVLFIPWNESEVLPCLGDGVLPLEDSRAGRVRAGDHVRIEERRPHGTGEVL